MFPIARGFQGKFWWQIWDASNMSSTGEAYDRITMSLCIGWTGKKGDKRLPVIWPQRHFANVFLSLGFFFGALVAHVRKRGIAQVWVPRERPALPKIIFPHCKLWHLMALVIAFGSLPHNKSARLHKVPAQSPVSHYIPTSPNLSPLYQPTRPPTHPPSHPSIHPSIHPKKMSCKCIDTFYVMCTPAPNSIWPKTTY